MVNAIGMRKMILLAGMLASLGLALPTNLAAQPNEELEQQAERERARAQRENELAEELAREEAARARAEAERERADVEREREAVEQQAQRNRAEAEREREQVQRELERAQAELEEAARDVARLSAEYARPFVGDVMQRFRYAGQRALLGLNIQDADQGVRVAGVSPNGPAAAAGVQAEDVIIAIDGAELAAQPGQSPSELLLAQMENVEPGESVTLTVARGDEEMDLTLVAREFEPGDWFADWPGFDFDFDFDFPRPPDAPDAPAPGFGFPWSFGAFGAFDAWRSMELVSLTPELGAYFGTEEGILVVRAPEDGELGLRDGDVILDIGGREPTSPEHAMRILASFEPGETLRVTVMRERRRENLEFELPAASERG